MTFLRVGYLKSISVRWKAKKKGWIYIPIEIITSIKNIQLNIIPSNDNTPNAK